MLHRTRDLLIRQRSSLISAICAHFADIVVGQGIRNVERLLMKLLKLYCLRCLVPHCVGMDSH